MENYKYNCSTFEYLKMESGLIPVPNDSKNTYIVNPVEVGDKGIADNKIYEYNGSEWVYLKDFDFGEDLLNDTKI